MIADAEHLRRATIAEIEVFLQQAGARGRAVLALLEQDPRVGVRRLAVRERQRWRRRQAEACRQRRLRQHEEALWKGQITRVAGVDEVGRGCLAGPVIAAAVILPPGTELPGVDDSKALDATRRQDLRRQIEAQALAWSVAAVSAARIDHINILEASLEAMRIALGELDPSPQHVLVDGNRAPGSGHRETCLVRGDARSLSIAAASIIAKVHRDELMVRLDAIHPAYGFARNKGYASPLHRQALAQVGPCPEHRRSFAPLARCDSSRRTVAGCAPARASTGIEGEQVAIEYLRRKGYGIEDCRYRGAGGEIDIVARQQGCWVFVEVKTTATATGGGAEARLGAAQRRRLARAARHFLRFRGGEGDCRFDVISVDLSRQPPSVEHWSDAFFATDGMPGSP